ncbi:hypothetical protein BC834DRAFT_871886 [Gloeopeniophorella convolvens]|nr:hypothetical protein BC834DRAFT_871886 [Gloeopeniophorella convolvens]
MPSGSGIRPPLLRFPSTPVTRSDVHHPSMTPPREVETLRSFHLHSPLFDWISLRGNA